MDKEIKDDYNAYYHYSSMASIRALELRIEVLENTILDHSKTPDLMDYMDSFKKELKEDKDYIYLKSMEIGYKEKLGL